MAGSLVTCLLVYGILRGWTFIRQQIDSSFDLVLILICLPAPPFFLVFSGWDLLQDSSHPAFRFLPVIISDNRTGFVTFTFYSAKSGLLQWCVPLLTRSQPAKPSTPSSYTRFSGQAPRKMEDHHTGSHGLTAEGQTSDRDSSILPWPLAERGYHILDNEKRRQFHRLHAGPL